MLAISLLPSGMHTIDAVFEFTLQTPPLDLTPKPELVKLAQTMPGKDMRTVLLVAHNAKPAGIVAFDKESYFPEELRYQKIELDPHVSLAMGGMLRKGLYFITSTAALVELNAAHDELVQSLNGLHSYGMSELTDMFMGILLGYPVADALACNPCQPRDFDEWLKENEIHEDLSLLIHCHANLL